LASVPYDGKLAKADGKGLWWEGLDPQISAPKSYPGHKIRMALGSGQRQQRPRRGLHGKIFQAHSATLGRLFTLIRFISSMTMYYPLPVLPMNWV
jgi:alpha-L-fucosidase